METKKLSVLNDRLLSHVTGGAEGEVFTCLYNRAQKKQYGAVDDSEGNVIRYIGDQPAQDPQGNQSAQTTIDT